MTISRKSIGLFGQAIDGYKEPVIPAKPMVKSAVVVNFNAQTDARTMEGPIWKLAPEMSNSRGRMGAVYNTESEAMDRKRKIEAVVDDYNDRLINQPFEAAWLDNYLTNKNCGIEHVQIRPHVNDTGALIQLCKESEADALRTHEYLSWTDRRAQICLDYSGGKFVGDLADFAFKSGGWAGFKSRNEAIECFSGILAILRNVAKDHCLLHRFAAQNELMAIDRKLETMDTKGKPRNNLAYFKLSNDDNFHLVWKESCGLVSDYLENSYGAVLQATLKEIIETEKVLPGIDGVLIQTCAPDGEHGNANVRMGQDRLRYDLNEQGISLADALAGAVAAYYLEIGKYRSEAMLVVEAGSLAAKLDSVDVSKEFKAILERVRRPL